MYLQTQHLLDLAMAHYGHSWTLQLHSGLFQFRVSFRVHACLQLCQINASFRALARSLACPLTSRSCHNGPQVTPCLLHPQAQSLPCLLIRSMIPCWFIAVHSFSEATVYFYYQEQTKWHNKM